MSDWWRTGVCRSDGDSLWELNDEGGTLTLYWWGGNEGKRGRERGRERERGERE